MLLVVILFLNKGKGLPWETSLHHIFITNIVLSSLRSFDKILIFLPFMLLMPICLYSHDLKRKLMSCILLTFTLVICWPFINGNIYKKYYGVQIGKNYINSSPSSLVKIPQEYFNLVSKINREKGDFRIISIPWSLDNPDLKGWLISPRWNVKSVNPITQYLNHPLVQMNDPTSFRGWNYGIEWNSQEEKESAWLMPFLGALNVKYIIFQKDVPEIFVKKAALKINFYKEKGYIKLISSNEYFDFYEVSNVFYLPHFYVPDRESIVKDVSGLRLAFSLGSRSDKPVVLESSIQILPESVFASNNIVIEYRKISPAKYKVKFHNITKTFSFVFSESFHSSWKVYPVCYVELSSGDIEGYKTFEQNDLDQASKEELLGYIRKGHISELGDGSIKNRKSCLWQSFNSEQCYVDSYRFDFISKKIKDTVQNDNLDKGNFYETLQLNPINNRFHQIANGYANFWLMDKEYLHNNFPGVLKQNQDGSFDLEVIIEFVPQKILNFMRIYVQIFGAFILILLAFSFSKKETDGK